jgi:glucan phosphoethanolaminetransferase (alkaline phosphatase superfamily)
MIQRIQTVFLLVSFVASLLMFFFPIAWYYGEMNTIAFYLHQLKDSVPDNQPLYNDYFLLPLILVNLLIAAASVYALLSFRALSRQLKVIKFGIFAAIIMIAALFFFYTDHISKTVHTPAQYEFGVFLPLISLVFFLLASRSVQRDIKLIRSVDRLR